jgi:hypothetical protein
MIAFSALLKKQNVVLFDDAKYREEALENFFFRSNFLRAGKEDFSLVDEVIKLILCDKSVGIHHIISFDSGLNNYASAQGVKVI